MPVLVVDEQTYDEVVGTAQVPVLVDVTARWCPPCRAMEPVLEELTAEVAGALVVVSADADDAPEVALRLGVMSFPTLVVLVAGEERARFVGARGPGRLREDLRPFLPTPSQTTTTTVATTVASSSSAARPWTDGGVPG